MPSQFTLVETAKFNADLSKVRNLRVDHQALEDVLVGVRWALTTNPLAHDLLQGTPDIRVRKTVRVDRGTASVPMLRVLFRVDGNLVQLLSLDTLDLIL
ncbi:MAG TPA: hypothetical protein VJK02_24690 [Anaerolineales bacterium]|nr:hypothetical protein [Anaerolineales bacterium]